MLCFRVSIAWVLYDIFPIFLIQLNTTGFKMSKKENLLIFHTSLINSENKNQNDESNKTQNYNGNPCY